MPLHRDLSLMGYLNVAFFPHKILKEYPNRNYLENFYNLHLKSNQVNMSKQVEKNLLSTDS